jgi:hypothetical protein
VQVAALGCGSIAIFGRAELQSPGGAAIADLAASPQRYEAACLTPKVFPGLAADSVAVWPDDVMVPDVSEMVSRTAADLDCVVLVQAMERQRLVVCDRRDFALYPADGLPFFNQFARHRPR